MIKRILLLTITFLNFCLFSHSQSITEDTQFVAEGKKGMLEIYKNKLGNQNPLYVGVEYVSPPSTHQHFPFFEVDDFENGNITINRIKHSNVPLLYDILSDKVITEMGNTTIPIELISEKIASFEIMGHHFIRINKDSVNNTLPVSGFYERIYEGKSMVVVQHKKSTQRLISGGVENVLYNKKRNVYVRHSGSFYRIKSKGALLKLFVDQKQKVRSFIKENRMKFKASEDIAIGYTAAFYDSLRK